MSLGSRIKPEDIRSNNPSGQYLDDNVINNYIDRIIQPCTWKRVFDFEKYRKVDFGYLKFLSNYLWKKVTNPPWIAGGSILSVFDNHHSDIDIFFPDEHSFKQTITVLSNIGYYFTDEDRKLIEKDMSAVKFIQCKPKETNSKDPHKNKDIQLIKMMWYKSPSATLMSFDVSVCKFALQGDEILYPEFALKDVKDKRLTISTRFAGSGIYQRIKKYYDRGYRFGDPELDNLFGNKPIAKDFEEPRVIRNTGESNWANPQYRFDYYHLEARDFKQKWSNND